jgi:hypothetical protein
VCFLRIKSIRITTPKNADRDRHSFFNELKEKEKKIIVAQAKICRQEYQTFFISRIPIYEKQTGL